MWVSSVSIISKLSILYNYLNIIILYFFFLFICLSMIINSIKEVNKKYYILSYFFWCFIFITTISLIFLVYKFYLSNIVQIFSYLNNSYLNTISFYNIFGDTLNCLCLLTTIISFIYLSERYLFKLNVNIFYFFIFVCCTLQMTTTNDIFVMFIYFELLFIPSLFFVYHLGYSKKVDITITYLLKWTLSGSFICLLSFCYFFFINSSLLITSAKFIKLSTFEQSFLIISFFIGFGIKLPIWPFYYWLTKVHVEAPTGFSIFLSGFLVKTAFFCFSYLFFLCASTKITTVMLTIAIWGSFDASFRMWTSNDIKRLIAFATIQEMNLIIILLFILNCNNYSILNCFLLVHGILSSLFFYLVDQVQKQTFTRNIMLLSGISLILPLLTFLIWWGILIFRGFPTFIKFLIEWEILMSLINCFQILGFFIFFFICFFSVLGFCRIWFVVLYGSPKNIFFNKLIMFKDYVFGFSFGFILFILNFLLYLF